MELSQKNKRDRRNELFGIYLGIYLLVGSGMVVTLGPLISCLVVSGLMASRGGSIQIYYSHEPNSYCCGAFSPMEFARAEIYE